MNDKIQYLEHPRLIEVRLSLQVALPGHRSVFIEGLTLQVDPYMYECYREAGDLDMWLRHQAVQFLLDNSTLRKVALDKGQAQ